MWAVIDVIIDGFNYYQREVWLTAGTGSWARDKRIKIVDEHVRILKSRCRAAIETADCFEIILTLKSSLYEEKFQDKKYKV